MHRHSPHNQAVRLCVGLSRRWHDKRSTSSPPAERFPETSVKSQRHNSRSIRRGHSMKAPAQFHFLLMRTYVQSPNCGYVANTFYWPDAVPVTQPSHDLKALIKTRQKQPLDSSSLDLLTTEGKLVPVPSSNA